MRIKTKDLKQDSFGIFGREELDWEWGRWQNRCADARVKVRASTKPQVARRWSQDTTQNDAALLQKSLQGPRRGLRCLAVKIPSGK